LADCEKREVDVERISRKKERRARRCFCVTWAGWKKGTTWGTILGQENWGGRPDFRARLVPNTAFFAEREEPERGDGKGEKRGKNRSKREKKHKPSKGRSALP